ncbi:hypothetical protein [Streptomyces violaceorubidus]|uniref:hypothetical protein n=1 Tax=Streptomyces violaceorubidus TaxID=284042 RepID=UPI0006920058|nr:hypothetical protein [Streptomyces violaceorubidus]
MGTALVNFVYTTMRKRLNNPGSRYWLPTLLKEVKAPDGGTLTPLRAAEWKLGAIGGEQGTLVGNIIAKGWWMAVGAAFDDAQAREDESNDLPEDLDAFTARRSEANPLPTLAFSSVEIHHLPNAAVGELTGLTEDSDGYRGSVRITLGAHSHDEWKDRDHIKIKSRYLLRQEVVAADDPDDDSADPLPPTTTVVRGLEGVSWPKQVVEGRGTLELTARDLAFDVQVALHVSGKGSGRTLAARVDSISLAAGVTPTFCLARENLTIEDEGTDSESIERWKHAALEAVNSADAGRELRAAMEAALSDPGQRDEFSTMVTQQLAASLDGVLGSVPTGALPVEGSDTGTGPVEQYLFDRVRHAVNSPASSFYPPAVIHSLDDPGLVPYRIPTLDLGPQSVEDIELSAVRLHDVTVDGLPNLLIPPEDARLTAEGIDLTLRLGRITGRPEIPGTRGSDGSPLRVPEPPLVLTGRFEAVFPPSSEDEDDVLRGQFKASLARPSVAAGLVFSGPDADALEISLRSLDLRLAPEELTVEVTTGDLFREVMRSLFDSAQVKTVLVQGIRTRTAARKDEIAAGLSTAARDIIAAHLTQ